MRQRVLFALVVAAASAVAGCSKLGRAAFQEPTVELKDVKLRGVGLTGGNLDVVLDVYNPNQFRLDATRMTYKVAMAGDSITIASGALDSRLTLQDKTNTQVTIPVSFTYAGLGAAGRSLMNTGAVNYHVSGDVTVGSPVGSFTIPYSATGRFTTTGVAK